MKSFKKMLITIGIVLIATVIILALSHCSKQSYATEVYNG